MKKQIILEAYRMKYSSENSLFRGDKNYNPHYKFPEMEDINGDTIYDCQYEIVTMFKNKSKDIIRKEFGINTITSINFSLNDLIECILDKDYAAELNLLHEEMLDRAKILHKYCGNIL